VVSRAVRIFEAFTPRGTGAAGVGKRDPCPDDGSHGSASCVIDWSCSLTLLSN